ncbi:MAG: hypothetical protein M1829_001191 [Trizodia sp. TS-e1964]|nr:MAG: hypothetical protein M1829_001191 [Trizodia sp. TS-e1964]
MSSSAVDVAAAAPPAAVESVETSDNKDATEKTEMETKMKTQPDVKPEPEPEIRPKQETQTTTTTSTTPTTCDLNPEGEPPAPPPPDLTDTLPTSPALALLNATFLLSPSGASVPFSSLHSGGPNAATRVLVIFVRHFFCGICQEFLRTLSAALSPAALLALPEPTAIAIVGCGRPERIEAYARATGCPFPIYADPARKAYEALGMARTLALGAVKPRYVGRSMLAVTLSSFVQSLRSGRGVVKGGDYWQVGGEVLFVNGEVRWIHRMRNTRDHSEVGVLAEVLGVEGEDVARGLWDRCAAASSEA